MEKNTNDERVYDLNGWSKVGGADKSQKESPTQNLTQTEKRQRISEMLGRIIYDLSGFTKLRKVFPESLYKALSYSKGAKLSDDDELANQIAIDVSLQLIAKKLVDDLFKNQDQIRKLIEKRVVNGGSESVSRKFMQGMLKDERDVVAEIEKWKNRFNQFIEIAEELGYTVFKRNENKYHIYRALEVNYTKLYLEEELEERTSLLPA